MFEPASPDMHMGLSNIYLLQKQEVTMNKAAALLILVTALIILNNCSSNPAKTENEHQNEFAEMKVMKSEGVSRQTAIDVSSDDMNALVQGNIKFAFDMYAQMVAIKENHEKNVFFSPYSISVALAMTLSGAEGKTETEMHNAMRFALAEPDLHKAFNKLDMDMETAAEKQENLTLSVVNTLWGQHDYSFRLSFLDMLAAQYGAGMNLVDFKNSPEPSRILINKWVEEQTHDRIKDLLPKSSINSMTTLVLTNAIYFLADWLKQFNPDYTIEKDFLRVDGTTVTASLMSMSTIDKKVKVPFAFNKTKTIKAIELAYVGDRFSMMAIMPVNEDFAALEINLDTEELNSLVSGLDSTNLHVSLPRFTFGSSSISLSEPLQNMGMNLAFNNADFSGIDGTRFLFISNVYHKAFIEVTEQGTEAAAATAVVIAKSSIPAPSFIANRPFIYLIRDRVTGAILFMGRVMDPTDKGEA